MKHLDLTLATPAGNLACDEALLDACEQGDSGQVLRFWESPQPFVVLGYANHLTRELNFQVCQERNLPILRRCSGGGTVLQGPGCLNYSLILRIHEAGPLATVHGANTFIMATHRDVFRTLLKPARSRQGQETVDVQGHTDLTIGRLKFSGNAQRRRKRSLLFHGTFLLRFDLSLLDRVLLHPSKEPEYRSGRPHEQFVTNVPLSAAPIKQALLECWHCDEPLVDVPWTHIEQLVNDKYGREEWNLKNLRPQGSTP